MTATTPDTHNRDALVPRALRLEYLSLGWNAVAGMCVVVAGFSTASVALLGFGLDVAIDSLDSGLLVWRFLKEARGVSHRARAEQHATRGVGVALVAAALYIAAHAVHSLLAQAASGVSAVGVAMAILSVCLLPPLGYGKIRLAARMESAALRGDGVLTTVGAVLAAVTLLGLVVKTRLGWWWADPLVALLITSVLLREGWRALRHAQSA